MALPAAPPLLRLLHAASHDRADLTLAAFDAGQIRWAVEAGLGPWLRRCTGGDPQATASALWPLVQAADLTARVIVGEQLDALDEIVAATADHAPPLTLLKGVDLCEQYYPEPHLRLMGDIDLLADAASIPAIKSRLGGLGYEPRSDMPAGFYETHHHVSPLFHPRRRVWVELHRGLVPSRSHVGSDGVFRPQCIDAERRPGTFRGRAVHRLTDELQVVYLAAHWAIGPRRVGAMIGMLDVMRLLRHAPALRWSRIVEWLDTSPGAAASLYLLLTYLGRRRLIGVDPGVLRDVRARQRAFGPANLAILHALLDRYVVGGRPLGRRASDRLDTVWAGLLAPGGPSRNLRRALWRLLPSRAWLMRR